MPGVGFFNSGPVAGASQPHRHMQAVPLDTFGSTFSPPVEELLAQHLTGRSGDDAGARTVPGLPFAHALALLPVLPSAAALASAYAHVLAHSGARTGGFGSGEGDGPYNLLLGRRWMLAVPRSSPRFDDDHSGGGPAVEVNGLAFLGCLLVRGSALFAAPVDVLTAVTRPRFPTAEGAA
jgi:ATP adenylyltransferase